MDGLNFKWQRNPNQIFMYFIIFVKSVFHKSIFIAINVNTICGGARGVMVIVIGNGHEDMSSSPGRD